jgi:hypothetical protein
MVYAGIAVETTDFEDLWDAMDKLQLNDALVWNLNFQRHSVLRFPLRFLRNAAHGDYSGTSRTEIRYDGYFDRSVGRIHVSTAKAMY